MKDNTLHAVSNSMDDSRARKIAISYLEQVFSKESRYEIDPDHAYFAKEQEVWVFPLRDKKSQAPLELAIRVNGDGTVKH